VNPKHLSNEAFFFELENRQGLIPVSINVDDQQVVWLDMEMYHFYEGFFHKSLNTYSTLKKNITISFATNLDVLEDDLILKDYIYPTGFIFHAGRCGSTLLSKSLARSRENLVLSEAPPLNQIFQVFTKNGERPVEINEKNKRIYRNLLLAMARRRVSTHKHLFVKFTSFNINFFSFIHSIFPDVPAIFLTRNKPDIIASYRKRPPAWLSTNPQALKMLTGSDSYGRETIIDIFLKKAADISPDSLKPIDYEILKPCNLSLILSYLNWQTIDSAQLEVMKSQFEFDSKIEFNKKKFES
jgi:hypothetical protein